MTTTYLKIENPGVAPVEAFTILGASTTAARGNTRTIGRFGSGSKHSVSVCLRHELTPVIFAGNLKLNFGTKPLEVDDGIDKNTFQRIFVKFSGKDETGASRTATEDLGYVLEYGSSDWQEIDLALREFISNAIDRAIAQGEQEFAQSFLRTHNYDTKSWSEQNFLKEECQGNVLEYRKYAQDFNKVTIEIVNENQVRAKTGMTRVFVPCNEDVYKFYHNVGKWFLHFSEPASINKQILPKKNRNLSNRKAAVIYKKGVRVREFESDDVPSLFDYNLDDLELDEARNVDDWRVRHAAGVALASADADSLATLLHSFLSQNKYWEHSFDHYALDPTWQDDDQELKRRSTNWSKALSSVIDEDGVLVTDDNACSIAKKKGYSTLVVPESYLRAGEKYGLKTASKVLSQDDREGREVIEPTDDAIAAVDFVWEMIKTANMTNGKEKPKVKVFRKIMEAGGQLLGFYRDGVVYINEDITTGSKDVLSQQLLVTALEETSHWVSGAQDFVLNLCIKLAW